ncbi:MAG TPA: hypothetical protein VME47_21435 [Acetobacteraceae bacterium]|nr:hypothetical protein [Acetobacteraceae bacterium]
MADTRKPAKVGEVAAAGRSRPVKFTPGGPPPLVRQDDVAALAPRQEPEPPVAQGIDLSGKPKLVFAAGRGKTGKTTLLRWLTEKSLGAGGSVLLADIDPSNASFSAYFEDVSRPDTDDPAGVRHWLVELLDFCAAERHSAIVDLGGGDTTLRAIATDMPGFATQLDTAGVAPVMFYLCGTQPEDLAPALTLAARGFAPTAQALVLNEYSIPTGVPRAQAFARLVAAPAFTELSRSGIQLWMPRLFAADAIESRRCWFTDAREGKVDPPLGVSDSVRLRAWLDAMDRRFAGVRSWIP